MFNNLLKTSSYLVTDLCRELFFMVFFWRQEIKTLTWLLLDSFKQYTI